MISLQPLSVYSSKFYTPQANRFTADGDASLSEQILDISMAEIESVVEPNGVGNDIGWESVALVGIQSRFWQLGRLNLSALI